MSAPRSPEAPHVPRRWCVDGQWRSLRVDPRRPLLHTLREDLGVTGPKEGCGEGECGACTLLINDLPALACLVASGALADGARIDTIEAIARRPLGAALLATFAEHGAVQCGACIPGIIVTAYSYLREEDEPTRESVRDAISGNLCRCTGYVKILDAILAAPARVAAQEAPPAGEPASPPSVEKPREEQETRGAPYETAPAGSPAAADPAQPSGFFVARSLAEALEYRARVPGCVPLAGGTDLVVAWNAAQAAPVLAGDVADTPASPSGEGAADARQTDTAAPSVLYLGELDELRGVRRADGQLCIGALTIVEELARDAAVATHAPALSQAARALGARQVRQQATIGGNIVNASPAADLVPPLIAAGATLVLGKRDRRRDVVAEDFFRGYKMLDLAPDELLLVIRLPELAPDEREAFRKLGTRRAQSIAKVSAAARLSVAKGRVTAVTLAAGSVAPTVVRLPQTERRVRGAALTPDRLARVPEWVAAEISPISDVRSSAGYRRAMAGVLIAQLLRELANSY